MNYELNDNKEFTTEQIYRNNIGKYMIFKLIDNMIFKGKVIGVKGEKIYIDNNGVVEEIIGEDIRWSKWDNEKEIQDKPRNFDESSSTVCDYDFGLRHHVC